jgi:hypothetical protein
MIILAASAVRLDAAPLIRRAYTRMSDPFNVDRAACQLASAIDGLFLSIANLTRTISVCALNCKFTIVPSFNK